MIREDFCKRCSRYAGCGFISRNLQTKCDIIQIFEEGYEQGYEDAINKACEWFEETFKDGEVIAPLLLVQLIDKFRKAMKGEQDET